MAFIYYAFYNRCIRGYLNDKVVILVTHQLHFLKKVDKIIVLHQGEISEMGSFDELMSNTKGRLHTLLEECNTQSHNSTHETTSKDSSTLLVKSEDGQFFSKSTQNIAYNQEDALWDSNR